MPLPAASGGDDATPANVDACIMALHLSAMYSDDAVAQVDLCRKVVDLNTQQRQRGCSSQLQHAASAAAAAHAMLDRIARTNPAAVAAATADVDAAAADVTADAADAAGAADATSASNPDFPVGSFVTLAGLSTQHLNGLICQVVGVMADGRVPLVPVDPPAALQQTAHAQGFKVKTINCCPLPPKTQKHSAPSLTNARRQHCAATLDDASPLHTVIKAIEVALFACASRVCVRLSRVMAPQQRVTCTCRTACGAG